MTHIELSLSPLAQGPSEPGAADPLEQWAAPVAAVEESCLVVDASGVIFAASRAFMRMFGLTQGFQPAGRDVRDVLYLIDFTAAGNELGDAEREQIPPLLVLNSRKPERGLMRVRIGSVSQTLDAVATPLRRQGEVVGSLSFFAVV
jgi:hypothetical protein